MTGAMRGAFCDVYRDMVHEHLEWYEKSKADNDKAAEKMARDYDWHRIRLDWIRKELEKGEPHTFERDLRGILRFLNTNKKPELARKLREIIDGLAFQFERTKKKGMGLKDNEIRNTFLNLYRDLFFAHLRWRNESWRARHENVEAAEIARVYDACRILIDMVRLKFEKGEPYRSFQQDLDTILGFLYANHDRDLSRSLKEIIDALKGEESDE